MTNPTVASQFRTKFWALASALSLASCAVAQVSLGTAQNFAVLGASTVTNTGPSLITGDLGVSPSTAITGFPPGVVVGTIHDGDAVAVQAQMNALTSYNTLAGLAPTQDLTGQGPPDKRSGHFSRTPPNIFCPASESS